MVLTLAGQTSNRPQEKAAEGTTQAKELPLTGVPITGTRADQRETSGWGMLRSTRSIPVGEFPSQSCTVTSEKTSLPSLPVMKVHR